jgi:hypothetical protein
MTNLRKAALEYLCASSIDGLSSYGAAQARSYEAGYGHAIAVIGSEAYRRWCLDNDSKDLNAADFLSKHANESAPEGEDE